MARKSRKSEAQRTIERQYAKAVRNFWAQATSMVKRGYIVNTVLPDKPKRITAGSVRAVQRQQKKLYAEAQYINQQTGEVLTGGQGRVTERKRSAEKARQTRAVKQFGKSIRQLIDNLSTKRGNTQESTDADKQWEKRKREEDEQDKERLRTDEVYRAGFDGGRVALQWLFGSIEEISRKYPNSGARLKAVVEQAISVKGEQGVGLAIASANDEALAVMQELDASAYSPEGARFTGALVTLNQILMGTSLSAEEMQVMQDATDADMYWDDLAEE
jgi:hypothetical protein